MDSEEHREPDCMGRMAAYQSGVRCGGRRTGIPVLAVQGIARLSSKEFERPIYEDRWQQEKRKLARDLNGYCIVSCGVGGLLFRVRHVISHPGFSEYVRRLPRVVAEFAA